METEAPIKLSDVKREIEQKHNICMKYVEFVTRNSKDYFEFPFSTTSNQDVQTVDKLIALAESSGYSNVRVLQDTDQDVIWGGDGIGVETLAKVLNIPHNNIGVVGPYFVLRKEPQDKYPAFPSQEVIDDIFETYGVTVVASADTDAGCVESDDEDEEGSSMDDFIVPDPSTSDEEKDESPTQESPGNELNTLLQEAAQFTGNIARKPRRAALKSTARTQQIIRAGIIETSDEDVFEPSSSSDTSESVVLSDADFVDDEIDSTSESDVDSDMDWT